MRVDNRPFPFTSSFHAHVRPSVPSHMQHCTAQSPVTHAAFYRTVTRHTCGIVPHRLPSNIHYCTAPTASRPTCSIVPHPPPPSRHTYSIIPLWLPSYMQHCPKNAFLAMMYVYFALFEGMNLCDKWLDMCSKLTGLYWANYGLHMWQVGQKNNNISIVFFFICIINYKCICTYVKPSLSI